MLLPIALGAAVLARNGTATLAVDDVKPGMKGYGLTVFRGQKPERFDVEVIDVLHNFRADQDLILVRTRHPILEQAITVAGMSGSPVYLEGKLAGAYAYAWPYGKEQVAGVTPIANMFAEIDRAIHPELWRALGLPTAHLAARDGAAHSTRAPRFAGLPTYRPSQKHDAFSALRMAARKAGVSGGGAASDTGRGPQPAATPLLLGGVTEAVTDTLEPLLDPFGLVPMQTGGAQRLGSGDERAKPPRYRDGGAIGVQLIRGDVTATAVGTVTHVADRRLVAFGHPMMNQGQTALPAATARVLHVLASQRRSFKIAEAVEPLGTLVHDRQAGIVVDTELRAPTIPLRIHLKDVPAAPRNEWHMELANHRVLTPALAFTGIMNALSAAVAEQSDVMFTAKTRVTLADHGTVEIEDVGHAGHGMDNARALSSLRLFDLLDVTYGNPFEYTQVRGIDVELSLRYGREVSQIIDASTASEEVDPGETLDVYVTVRPFGKPARVETIQVPIPYSAAGEEIEIVIQPGDDVTLEPPKPTGVSDLIQIVKSGYHSTSLVASVQLPSPGLRMYGQVVRRLPGSAWDSLQRQNQAERAAVFPTFEHHAMDVGTVLYGDAKLKLKVREQRRH